jgi:hypothetical protein
MQWVLCCLAQHALQVVRLLAVELLCVVAMLQ